MALYIYNQIWQDSVWKSSMPIVSNCISFSAYIVSHCVFFLLTHIMKTSIALQWRHNERHGVSNHQPHDCLPNRLFRRRSKKTSKLCVPGLCVGNSHSPYKWPVTRKMFPFDDVFMDFITLTDNYISIHQCHFLVQPCLNYSVGFTTPLSKLDHGRVIKSYVNMSYPLTNSRKKL